MSRLRLFLSLLVSLLLVVPAGAQAATIDSSSMRIQITEAGQFQAQLRSADGALLPKRAFYNPDFETGDAGLFLAFPTPASPSELPGLDGKIAAPPTMSNVSLMSPSSCFACVFYTPVSVGPVTGDGSAFAPYMQSTVYKVNHQGVTVEDTLLITQTTTHVAGTKEFAVMYTVANVHPSATVKFRASHAADLFLDGSDVGVANLVTTPKFLGALNATTGRQGGLLETTPWNSHLAVTQSSLWDAVRSTRNGVNGTAFTNAVTATSHDTAMAVQFDHATGGGLAPGAQVVFSVKWKFGALNLKPIVTPLTASRRVSETQEFSIRAVDLDGAPRPDIDVNVSVASAAAGHPRNAALVARTNAQGIAVFALKQGTPGVDNIDFWFDLTPNGIVDAKPANPNAVETAKLTWVPPTAPTVTLKASSLTPGRNQLVQFDASGSKDEDGSVAEYEWDLDDNGEFEIKGISPVVERSFAALGTYKVHVKVIDNEGLSTKSTVEVKVANAAPIAAFNVVGNPVATGGEVTFDAAPSMDPDGTIVKWAWDVDGNGQDNAGFVTPQVKFAFPSKGIIKVRLTVTDNDGKATTLIKDVNVGPDNIKPVVAKPTLKEFTIKGFRARLANVTCQSNENGRCDVEMRVTRTTAKKLKLKVKKGAKTVVIGTATAQINKDKPVVMKVTFTPDMLKILQTKPPRKTFKVTTSVSATDAEKNTTVVKRTMTVKKK